MFTDAVRMTALGEEIKFLSTIAHGLANQLAIPRGEADAYIKKYFERFPGIRDYMESTKAFVREHGYVETIFGRRIHIRDVKAQNAATRAFGERQAINAPIQGSAADIIRRAMVRLSPALAENDLDAQLLLQVHDELVLEVKDAQAKQVWVTPWSRPAVGLYPCRRSFRSPRC